MRSRDVIGRAGWGAVQSGKWRFRRAGRRARVAVARSSERAETSPLPDVREVDGWVYSSLPLETVVGNGEIVVRRLRQTVSPEGELSEELDEIWLCALSAGALEREAEAAGLRLAGRRDVPPTDDTRRLDRRPAGAGA